tara:strand:+ start:668 stop:1000 length:333 start_codon:yes stop_codon:yes gene_type:complete
MTDHTQLKIEDHQIYVVSDLYLAGLTEDGEEHVAEQYFVALLLDDGRVFYSQRGWEGCKVVDVDEDGSYCRVFQDVRDQAESRAQRHADKVVAAGQVNLQNWVHVRTRGQ